MRVRVLGLAGALACALAACAGGERMVEPVEPPASVRWLFPSERDSVAGLVRLSVRVEPPGAPVSVFAGASRIVDIREDVTTPGLWRGIWRAPRVPATREMRLHAANEGGLAFDAIRVWVVPDSIPSARVRLPGRALCFAAGGSDVLIASGEDLEDGALSPDSLTWRVAPSETLVGTGPSFRPGTLAPGVHTLIVEARDRRGQPGGTSVRVRVAAAPSGDSPSACVESFLLSLARLDLSAAFDRLGPAFRFQPCGDPSRENGFQPAWNRSRFQAGLESWLSDPDVSRLQLEWRLERVSSWQVDGRSRAWIELALPELAFARGAGPWVDPREVEGVVERLTGGRASLLVESSGGDDWRIVSWDDHPPRGGGGLHEILEPVPPGRPGDSE